MSSVNVLSDSLKCGNLSNRISNIKGNATDSVENSPAEFAVMLSGLETINADPIGQNSKQGQDLEEGQNPDSIVQNLGYGHYLLSFLSQPTGLVDLPAGKEANSGNGVNQGTGEGLSADDKLSIVSLSKLSLDSNEVVPTKGLTSQTPQGNNPGITELDNYKLVIKELLVALSGQITDTSPKNTSLVLERGTSELQIFGGQSNTPLQKENFRTLEFEGNSKILNLLSSSRGVDVLRQIMESTAQDWLKGTDGAVENGPNSSLQKAIKPLIDFLSTEQGTSNRELNTKASSLQVVLNQLISQIQETTVPQRDLKEILQAKSDRNENLQSKSDGIESFFIQPKNNNLDFKPSATGLTAATTPFNPKLSLLDLPDSKSLINSQGIVSEKTTKGELGESFELSEVKASQNQTPSIGLEIASNGKIVTGNVIDGKTISIPVWEQISNAFREQVPSRHQELKELEIKLHPAELGRIHIGMRWENGQVNLQVHASEAATGQILQNQLLELRHTLTNQGVNCGTLQMGQHGEDHQQNRQGNESRKGLEQNPNLGEDEESISSSNPFSHRQDGDYRLNVTA